MFLKPALSKGRGEQDVSGMASVLDFTPSSGMEVIDTGENNFLSDIKDVQDEETCFCNVFHRFDAFMDYSIPEILRVPLEELCLHIMV